jgi:hypothetical protein
MRPASIYRYHATCLNVYGVVSRNWSQHQFVSRHVAVSRRSPYTMIPWGKYQRVWGGLETTSNSLAASPLWITTKWIPIAIFWRNLLIFIVRVRVYGMQTLRRYQSVCPLDTVIQVSWNPGIATSLIVYGPLNIVQDPGGVLVRYITCHFVRIHPFIVLLSTDSILWPVLSSEPLETLGRGSAHLCLNSTDCSSHERTFCTLHGCCTICFSPIQVPEFITT